MDVESLVVSLGLDPAAFSSGLQRAQTMAQDSGQKIASNLMGPLKMAFASLAAGFGLSSMLSTYTQQADAAGKLANSIGVNVEEMQAWGRAAKLSGGSAEGFNASLRGLNANLAMLAATGKGRVAPIFEEMGIKAKDASGKMKDSFAVLTELAEKAETMGKAEFAGLAQRLGLDQGTIMLLQSGRQSVQELVKEMKEIGVYQKQDAEIAAAFNDATDKLNWAMQSAGATIIRMVVPALTVIVDGLKSFVVFLRKHETFVQAFFGVLATILTARAIPAMARFAATTLRAMAPFAPLIAIVALLALLIDDLIIYMEGGESELDELWSVFGTGPEIAAALKQAWEDLKTMGKDLFAALVAAAKLFFSYFSGAWQPLIGMVKNFFQLIKAIAQGDTQAITDALKNLWENFKNFLKALVTGWVRLFGDAFNSIRGLLGNLWNWLKGKAADGVAAVAGVLSTAWDGIKAKAAAAWEAVTGAVSGALGTIVTGALDKWNNLKADAAGAWQTIVSGATDKWSALQADLTGIWGNLVSGASEKWNALKADVDAAWEGIVSGVSDFASNLLSGVQNAWNSVLDFFSGLNLFESGAKLLTTFVDGIMAKAGAVVDAVKGVFAKVREFMPFSDAHEGPLSQLTVSGEKMMSTFGEGAQQGEGSLLESVSGVFGKVRDAFSELLGGGEKPSDEPKMQPDSLAAPPPEAVPTAPVAVPVPEVMPPDTIAVPAPEVVPSDSVPVPKTSPQPAEESETGLFSSLAAAFESVSSSLASSLDGIFAEAKDGLSAMAETMASVMGPQAPDFALAGISPSITQNDNSQASNTTITTSVGAITINTQATDAQGIARELPGATRNAFQRAGSNAAISGVRQ